MSQGRDAGKWHLTGVPPFFSHDLSLGGAAWGATARPAGLRMIGSDDTTADHTRMSLRRKRSQAADVKKVI